MRAAGSATPDADDADWTASNTDLSGNTTEGETEQAFELLHEGTSRVLNAVAASSTSSVALLKALRCSGNKGSSKSESSKNLNSLL